MSDRKEVVLLADPSSLTADVVRQAKSHGVTRVLTREVPYQNTEDGLTFVVVSDRPGDGFASWVKVGSAKDLQKAVDAGSRGQSFVVVECSDWTIIPLENLVAEFRRRGRRLYAYASSKEEIDTAFAILERGVDGVVVPPGSIPVLPGPSSPPTRFSIHSARVTRVLDAGLGDRACVDTTSQLRTGEGMLVGSRASFFFLVHGETLPSEYMPARPFRVNAGALHSYVLSSEGKTRYLSELEPPDRVTIVDSGGSIRDATVGRIKIERRPLVLVEADAGGAAGAVILQKAETIRLVKKDGTPVSVTDLKAGDEVLVHTELAKGRHFGGEVEESIEEK